MTRKKKEKQENFKAGNSKYALKIVRRKRLAKSLGLPPETPYPVLNLYEV